jgi:FAD:protein FMN transferase
MTKKTISIFLCLIGFVLSSGCEKIQLQRKAFFRKEISTFEGIAMTIPYRIEIGRELTDEQHRKVINVIDTTFAEINTVYNKWNPNSEVSKINQLKAYEKMKLSQGLANFLKRCKYFVRLTHGKFDPTIEPLQALWKKHLEQNSEPTDEEIEAIRPAIGWDNIILNGTSIKKKHSLTALDLGGIAKGYAVDLLIERLKKLNFRDIFVEWGGEVKAIGKHPQGRNWAVYISNLDDLDPEHALAYVPLQDQAIATSGDYMQQWRLVNCDATYFHVFNPKTLKPQKITNTSIASASVLTKDCVTADALATWLLMCKDLEEAKAIAQKLEKIFPDSAYWLISRKDLCNTDLQQQDSQDQDKPDQDKQDTR